MIHAREGCSNFSFSWICNLFVLRKKLILCGMLLLVLFTVLFKWEYDSTGNLALKITEQNYSATPKSLVSMELGPKKDLDVILMDRNILRKNYRFLIKVLAYDRLDSLARCLGSLALADYAEDNVALHIFVDHFKLEDSSPITDGNGISNDNAKSRSGNTLATEIVDAKDTIKSGTGQRTNGRTFNQNIDSEKTGYTEEGVRFLSVAEKFSPVNLTIRGTQKKSSFDLNKRQMEEHTLNNFHKLLHLVDQFDWPYGAKEVFVRSQNVGLQSQWIEAWWPTSEDEFAFVMEDDMEVSPLFYRYLRGLIANYYYNPANFDASIFGISLQRPRFVAGKGGNKIHVDDNTRLFLYQMVGTWGQLLFPNPWKEFRLWYDTCKSKKVEPILEGMVTTGWYRRFGKKIWTPWFIKFVHSRGYFNLYTNFLKDRALSVSHRAEGVNYRKNAGPDSVIISQNTSDIDLWEMLPASSFKKYDFCFNELPAGRYVTSLDDGQIQALLSSIAVKNRLILVNFGGTGKALSNNWLCHMAKLGMQNYLIVGDDPVYSSDLARRGHAVIQLSASVLLAKFRLLIEDHEVLDYILHDLTLLYVAQQALQMSYDVWLTSAGTLWVKDPSAHVAAMNADFHGKEVGEEYDSRLLYIRSNNRTSLLLDCVFEEILSAANLLLGDQKQDLSKDMLGKAFWKCVHGLDIPVKSTTESLYADVQSPLGRSNVTVLQMPIFMADTNLVELIEMLKLAGLWMLDHELVCNGVFCHSNRKN